MPVIAGQLTGFPVRNGRHSTPTVPTASLLPFGARAGGARMLSVSPRTLLRWDADPEIALSPVVLGGVVRYRVADIR